MGCALAPSVGACERLIRRRCADVLRFHPPLTVSVEKVCEIRETFFGFVCYRKQRALEGHEWFLLFLLLLLWAWFTAFGNVDISVCIELSCLY